MARLPKEKPQSLPDPTTWVTAGRWAGAPGFSIQDHECLRALWFATRWATDRAPPLKHAKMAGEVLRVTRLSAPPPKVDGLMVELLCPSCPHKVACAGEPARNCRTCRHVVADAGWTCGLDGTALTVEQQRDGCELWEGSY